MKNLLANDGTNRCCTITLGRKRSDLKALAMLWSGENYYLLLAKEIFYAVDVGMLKTPVDIYVLLSVLIKQSLPCSNYQSIQR